MDTHKLINDALNRARIQHGLSSDRELAELLKVDDTTIYRWRAGKYPASLDRLLLLFPELSQTQKAPGGC